MTDTPSKTRMSRSSVGPGRNLVVCCDGTTNEIGKQLSNVLKLYRIAEKSEQQLVFYQPGIGTVAMPDSWGKWRQKAHATFEMATGKGLDRDVLAAYRFLVENYREGDRIYLFGFSRGAYTVRVLAGMIYLVGLLRQHQANFAGYALKAYKNAKEDSNYATAHEFREIVRPYAQVPIEFLGVWDTVSSVIVPVWLSIFPKFHLEELPFASINPAVKVVRHAVAIHEYRRMFRLKNWANSQKFQPNRYSQATNHTKQDLREVWFNGCHSDIGGGFVEEESALSKFPLRWMLAQARNRGLRIRTQMVNHIVLGHPRVNARQYTKPSADGLLHTSLTTGWRLLEFLPKNAHRQEWHERKIWWKRFYFPRGEPRHIPPDSLIHISAIERFKDNEKERPRNWPASYVIEKAEGP
ncbi:MAG: hypothetical protein CMO07_12300 [Thalassospira sp.]|jgi:uncharacterized protein (DUF2235 family)|nr:MULTISPECIES: DUF2235 domain-containing protein [Thalassospira]MBE71474.1 hypothetical protein [Thalassospira sp.]MBO9506896.1 DUF2235 domain-containing protein [Thalassospira sp. A3_1]ONH89255.1 hypothetical protein TH47_05045 [Thalassospira sp. MCCC 1A02803]|tara:strand:+ start:6817 stop:8043 length:1227 start_codon:yes stop_codon:yes gene_type:complete